MRRGAALTVLWPAVGPAVSEIPTRCLHRFTWNLDARQDNRHCSGVIWLQRRVRCKLSQRVVLGSAVERGNERNSWRISLARSFSRCWRQFQRRSVSPKSDLNRNCPPAPAHPNHLRSPPPIVLALKPLPDASVERSSTKVAPLWLALM